MPVESEEPTLREPLDALVVAEPALETAFLDGEQSQPHVRLPCDGENPFRAADGWDTEVSSVDGVALFPPVTGG